MNSRIERPQSIIDQDDECLDMAEHELERAIKALKRMRRNNPYAVRERAQTISQVVRAAYISIREIEWRDGIPTQDELEKISEYLINIACE